MHGLGNDYIYVNCLNQTIENPSSMLNSLATGILESVGRIGSYTSI
jgi:diaminopimelate epimerase